MGSWVEAVVPVGFASMLRVLRTIVLLSASVALWPTAAWAQDDQVVRDAPDQVVLAGGVRVPRGTVVGQVVVFHGTVSVQGVVDGDVVVLDGPISIGGFVNGSVVAVDGSVRLAATAKVGGDVIAHDRVTLTEGATVGGQVRQRATFSLAGPVAGLGILLAPIAMAVSGLLLALALVWLAPRGADKVAMAARTAPVASLLWGLGAAILLPSLAVLAAVTVVGLPVGLAVLLGLGLLAMVGFAWTVWSVGRLVVREPRSRLLALAAGWVVVAAVGLVPFLNVVAWVVASIFGVGAMTVAVWRARGTGKGRHRPGAPVALEPATGTAEPVSVPDLERGRALEPERLHEPAEPLADD